MNTTLNSTPGVTEGEAILSGVPYHVHSHTFDQDIVEHPTSRGEIRLLWIMFTVICFMFTLLSLQVGSLRKKLDV
jgi:hypothetical protein